MERNQIVVDGVEKLEEAIARVRRAQKSMRLSRKNKWTKSSLPLQLPQTR